MSEGTLLNQMKPAPGSKRPRKRVGRGIGSGLGKTCGKGHKGQLSRAGVSLSPGFEGGQMPLHRRVPKTGFKARVNIHTERLRMAVLNAVPEDQRGGVDLMVLKQLGLVKQATRHVKFYLSGELSGAFVLRGLAVTAGVKEAILKQGGQVDD